MRSNGVFLGLILSVAIGSVGVSAQGQTGARMFVFLSGSEIDSNQILFEYAAIMDLAGMEALPAAHSGAIVPYTDLLATLPDALDGWTVGEPFGGDTESLGITYSLATVGYTKSGSEENIDVTVYDTMSADDGTLPWSQFFQGWGWEFVREDGYARHATVAGYPAWEVYSNEMNGVGFLGISLSSAPIPEAGSLLVMVLAAATAFVARRASTGEFHNA